MKKILSFILACSIFVSCVSCVEANVRMKDMKGAEFEGFIILYQNGTREVVYPESNDNFGNFLLKMNTIRTTSPDVKDVMPNYIVRITKTANDPFYGHQGYLNFLNMPLVWDYITSSNNQYIVIMDSGVQGDHPDLANSVNTQYSYDTYTGQNRAIDDNGHGTHCAGISSGVGNNGIGISGMIWNIPIISIRIIGPSGEGTMANVFDGIDYMVNLKNQGVNITVVNCSFGGDGSFSQMYYDYFKKIHDAGIIAVCAVGNDNMNTDIYDFYPSNFTLDNIIRVGAMELNTTKADFSNYGAVNVDVFAPGVEIYSTYPISSYIPLSGTSMAAPVVSGLCALIKGISPNLTPQEVINIIKTNAITTPNLTGKCKTGGYINPVACIKALSPTPIVPTSTPIPSLSPSPTFTPTSSPSTSGGGGGGCNIGISNSDRILIFAPILLILLPLFDYKIKRSN